MKKKKKKKADKDGTAAKYKTKPKPYVANEQGGGNKNTHTAAGQETSHFMPPPNVYIGGDMINVSSLAGG